MPQHKQTVTLASGRKVEIVPLAYAAWEEMENRRLETLEQLVELGEGQKHQADILTLRVLRGLDLDLVKARTPKWDELREQLSREEYLELVAKLSERSAREAEPENLPAGGGGPQIPAAAGSAATAAATPSGSGKTSTAGGAATPSR